MKIDYYKVIAIMAYTRLHKDAPIDVKTWTDLSSTEREYLVNFAKTVIEIEKNLGT